MTTALLDAPLTLPDAREVLKFENSYSRLPAIIDLTLRLEWKDWVTLLGEEWTCCDNIAQFTDALVEDTPFADLIENPSWGRWMMDEAEREAFAGLPDTVTIWRGCYTFNKWGLSWSLDRERAAAFPFLHRYTREGEQALLVKATVAREEVIALKLDRNEAELIVHRPKHVSTSHL
ncbi:hypothetical protein GRI55_09750 [Erythrobacter citreus]|jgi:hypothetical protein|uniref:Uncharacterized protein n=1 Tax=Qipengyuania citrea TaxID=225971 RepID=A0A6I4UCF9_9SPHN|nr:hypothetical protein [Qipengyuania citrea]MDQ0564929.1 hypothetical protein [Qipengyuania citrea]MXP36056.1 hypothetical protein [Qipengyuania citrea]